MVAADDDAASQKITQRIQELGDWRGEMLAHLRKLIHEADPKVQEEWKWRGVPVWSHDGIICTGETYKQVVKLTFAIGASLKGPKKLFNSSLEGTTGLRGGGSEHGQTRRAESKEEKGSP